MSPDEAREAAIIGNLLGHMLEAADAIAAFIAGLDRESFGNDLKTIYAVRAAFITLGEAAGRLPENFRAAHPKIPWKQVRHYRNFMIHVYDRIDTNPMWETASRHVPVLREQIKSLLDECRPS